MLLKELLRPYYLRWLYFPLVRNSKPLHFDTCWRYPFWELEDVTLRDRFPAQNSPTPDVFIYPMTDLHVRIQRTQHFARELQKSGHRCVLLNPHMGREFPCPPLWSGRRRVAQIEERIFELHAGLRREPVCHHRLLTSAESESIAVSVAKTAAAMKSAGAVQLVSLPVWNSVAERIRRQFGFSIVYDCHDWLEGFSNIDQSLVHEEFNAIRNADLVLFSSRPLMDYFVRELRGVGAKSLLVRNGVEPERFQLSGRDKSAGEIVAGYAGAIENWFDSEILECCLAQNPSIRFVLIGRVENSKVRALQRFPNLEMRGEIPYDRLPGEIATFDIGLIPFRISELIRYTNPIKLYEYFSLGLPVVATPLPEVKEYNELVYLGSDPEEFSEQVGAAAAEVDRARVLRRRQVAKDASWEERTALWSQKAAALIRRSLLTPNTPRQR